MRGLPGTTKSAPPAPAASVRKALEREGRRGLELAVMARLIALVLIALWRALAIPEP